jgi:hypothetical protein
MSYIATGPPPAVRAGPTSGPRASKIEALLAPLSRDAGLVTVIDGSPSALSWLGSVRGMRLRALGLEDLRPVRRSAGPLRQDTAWMPTPSLDACAPESKAFSVLTAQAGRSGFSAHFLQANRSPLRLKLS